MKSLLLPLLVLFSFHSTWALAACRVIEYAELKDTSSPNLIKTFCHYRATLLLEIEQMTKLQSLMPNSTGENKANLQKRITETMQTIRECVDTQSKILSALRNRSESDQPPSCEGQGGGWSDDCTSVTALLTTLKLNWLHRIDTSWLPPLSVRHSQDT